MTHEHPIVPDQDKSGISPVSIPESNETNVGSGVTEKIETIFKYRMMEDMPVAEIEQQAVKLKDAILELVRDGKRLRLERVRLNERHETSHSRNLELKKDRMKKESRVAMLRSRCAAIKMEISNEGPTEIERLEKRKSELESDIGMFRETFEVHKRDRLRTLIMLQRANSMLQDVYTEKVLDKIIAIGQAGEESNKSTDLSGLTAELLGRLLVLEREESYLFGMINRSNEDENF